MGDFHQIKQGKNTTDPVAIVGIGCQLPGDVSNVEDLLKVLRDGRDCLNEVPPDRWNVDEFYDPDPLTPGKTYVRHGGFVSDIDRFDAGFFSISDAEASRIDPQQRMALQTVWHALENAGQSPTELENSNTGVFLAMMNTNGYSQMKGAYEGLEGVVAYDAIGDAMSITAGRISHFLGLEGPCFALDTACSGSLVATHLARQSILAGECDSAIVVGVSAILHPGIHIAFSKLGLMSRVGRCQAFDAGADGYVRGEGCVVVLLRRQSLAESRGDHIYASILGTAINQDGRSPALTAPNGETQEKVIRMALARVGLRPSDIGYVEAHGTGTPVGDPIEMSALANVYGPGRSAENPLYVGSVKTNFGHIESGAGLLGLVKSALSVDQGLILPSLHFRKLNPNIEIGHAPIKVPTKTMAWSNEERRRLAGVNSFGYSGTNAHAVLSQVHKKDRAVENPPTRPAEMLVLSTKAPSSLEELADRWISFLGSEPSASLSDLVFTAATGRAHLRHRLAVVAMDKADLNKKLKTWRAGRIPKGITAGQVKFGQKPKIAFVFTGQGSQYSNMGRELYEAEPRFQEALDRCAEYMDAELDIPIHEVLFGEASSKYLSNTKYVQPALFAIEYALSELLRHWEIEPDFVIGHSVGEIVAACIAGMLRLQDAVKFVVLRGRLMGGLPEGGKMLAVTTTVEQALKWIRDKKDEISIATVNGPRSVVVSGTAEAVDEIAYVATAEGYRVTELDVSHAFHSPLMEPILEELNLLVSTFRMSVPRIPVISNVSGKPFPNEISSNYWSNHVRQPVLFHQGVTELIDSGCKVFVEIGPHPVISSAIATASNVEHLRVVPTLTRDKKDFENLLSTLASLYVGGIHFNLDRLFWDPAYQRTSIPLYPFRRDRHWLRVNLSKQGAPQIKIDLHPLLGRAVGLGASRTVFETSIATKQPWVDHRVLGQTVFPGTAYIEMVARGYAVSKGKLWQPVILKDVGFDRPLLLKYQKTKSVNLTLSNMPMGQSDEMEFQVANSDDNNELYCRGLVADAPEIKPTKSTTGFGNPDGLIHPVGVFYGELRKAGLEYGALFSTVRQLWLGAPDSGEAVGKVVLSFQEDETGDNPFMTTVMLDGCMQVFGAALHTLDGQDYQGAFVPASIQSITIWRELPSKLWSHVSVHTNSDGRAALAHITILSEEGEQLAKIEGIELRRTNNLTVSSDIVTAASPANRIKTESRDHLIGRLKDLDRAGKIDVLSEWLASEVRDTLGQAAENIDLDSIEPSTVFLEIGLDSLMITELQRRIQEKLNFRFQPMQGLDYQSIESLAEFILDDVLESDSVVTP